MTGGQRIRRSANSSASTGQKALRARTEDVGPSGRGTAVEQAFGPLSRNGVPAVDGAQKRPADGRVGVGVSAAHDRVHHRLLQIRRMGELPESVAERRQDPALLVDVVGGRRHGGGADGVQQAALHPHLLGPTGDAAIEVLRLTFSTDGLGNRQGEEGVGLPTDRVRMGERRVLARPLGYLRQLIAGSKDAQRADPHQGAVGLAVRVGPAPETAGDRSAAIEGIRSQPEDVSLAGLLGIEPSPLRQHSGQRQRHLGVVGGLSGDGVPGPSIRQLPDAFGIFPSDLFRCLELHQAAQRVAGELSQQAPLGPGENAGV